MGALDPFFNQITNPLPSLASSGSSGTLSLGKWLYNPAVGNPLAGEIRFDNADPLLATDVKINKLRSDNGNLGDQLSNIEIGTLIYIKVDKNRFVSLDVASVVDNTTFFTYGIISINDGPDGLPTQSSSVFLAFDLTDPQPLLIQKNGITEVTDPGILNFLLPNGSVTNNGGTADIFIPDAANRVYINTEADFPTQDGTTVTITSGGVFIMGQGFTTAKKAVCQNGFWIIGSGGVNFAAIWTYTGTDDALDITDASGTIENIVFNTPNANQTFNFDDTVGNVQLAVLRKITIIATPKLCTINNMNTVNFALVAALDAADGVTVSGTGTAPVIEDFVCFVTSAAGIGIDYGSSLNSVIRIANVALIGTVAGATGIAGDGDTNLPAGSKAFVGPIQFLGTIAATPIDFSGDFDIRWEFKNTPPVPNSVTDFSASSTADETIPIVTQGVFVPADDAVWVATKENKWSATVNGEVTFLGETSEDVLVLFSGSQTKVGGGSNVTSTRLNVQPSGGSYPATPLIRTEGKTDTSGPGSVVAWDLITINEGDKVRLEHANLSGTSDVVISEGFRLTSINGF